MDNNSKSGSAIVLVVDEISNSTHDACFSMEFYVFFGDIRVKQSRGHNIFGQHRRLQ